MKRYALINTHMPREFVLLQGTGCKWHQCTFCNYHEDVSEDPYTLNREVLDQVTGQYGILDVINSGSAPEMDPQTITYLQHIVHERDIHTLWFEAHYMYRYHLDEFAALFPLCNVKFRCGVETFDTTQRQAWHKGIPDSARAIDIARYFHGACLLCCTVGQTREQIINDIRLAYDNFEYFSINIFCNNGTAVKRDEQLVEWFRRDVYPHLKDQRRIEVLMNNTDLGVG